MKKYLGLCLLLTTCLISPKLSGLPTEDINDQPVAAAFNAPDRIAHRNVLLMRNNA